MLTSMCPQLEMLGPASWFRRGAPAAPVLGDETALPA